MTAKIFPKGTDQETGLPVSIQRTGYLHNEEAKCIEIYYKKLLTYPNGTTKELSRERIIIQNVDAIPAYKDKSIIDGSEIDVAEVPAQTHYTDYCTQFNADAIGQAIDNHLSQM